MIKSPIAELIQVVCFAEIWSKMEPRNPPGHCYKKAFQKIRAKLDRCLKYT